MKKFLIRGTSITATLLLASVFAIALPASSAWSPGNYYAGTDQVFKAVDSPIVLDQTFIVASGSTLIIEPGVEIYVTHKQPAFSVDGEAIFAGTAELPIAIHNAQILFQKESSSEVESRIEAHFLQAANLLGIFDDLTQGISLQIDDSSFSGRKDAKSPHLRSRTPLYAWLTFVRELSFQRNSFELLPGFFIESFIHEPVLRVENNLFIGNSTSDESRYLRPSDNNMDGHWLKVRSLDHFTGNTFHLPETPVVKKVGYPAGPVAIKALDASNNFWAVLEMRLPGEFIDADSYGESPKILSVMAEPSPLAPTKETHLQSVHQDFSSFQKTLPSFSRASVSLNAAQKSQIRSAVEAHDTSQKFVCTGIRYFSQPISENITVLKRAKAACAFAKSLNPHLSTWYQNKPTRAPTYAGKVLLTVKYLDFGSRVSGGKASTPAPAEKQTAWFGSATAFVPPEEGIPNRSLYRNQCMDGSSSWGKSFLEIFGFQNGVYCSGDRPNSHYSVEVGLPSNFRPTEWRVVFEVFVPRYEGSLWAGTGHSMTPSSKMRYRSANYLIQQIVTEWSDKIPSDEKYRATVIRTWSPFDTYIAVGNMRVEFKGLNY